MHLDASNASRGLIRHRRAAYIEKAELLNCAYSLDSNFSPPPPRRPRDATSAMGQKGKSVLLRLVSEAGTGFFYTTRKNPVKTPHKLAFVKYDPVVRRRVLFTEKKMPSGKKR